MDASPPPSFLGAFGGRLRLRGYDLRPVGYLALLLEMVGLGLVLLASTIGLGSMLLMAGPSNAGWAWIGLPVCVLGLGTGMYLGALGFALGLIYEENPEVWLEVEARTVRILEADSIIWTGHLAELRLEGDWLHFGQQRLHARSAKAELASLLQLPRCVSAGAARSVPAQLTKLRAEALEA